MRWLSTLPIPLLFALLAGGCTERADGSSSQDPIAGTSYLGALSTAQLAENVRLVDEDSTLTVTFREGETLSAQVLFQGEIEILFGDWKAIEGPERMEIDDLVLDDEKITGSVKVQGVSLTLEATLANSRTTLDLSVSFLGSMTLRRVEPQDETTPTP